MFVASEATILHADLDAFYASVEQRDDPRLRGRPVIVGGGVVLAASYEAKAYGVRTAMGGAHARRLCPHAVVVPPRISAYSEATKAPVDVYRETAPSAADSSSGESFLDARALRPAPALDGAPAGARPEAAIGRGAGRDPRRAGRPARPQAPRGSACVPHRGAAAALRGLLASDALAHAPGGHLAHHADPCHGERAPGRGDAGDRAPGHNARRRVAGQPRERRVRPARAAVRIRARERPRRDPRRRPRPLRIGCHHPRRAARPRPGADGPPAPGLTRPFDRGAPL